MGVETERIKRMGYLNICVALITGFMVGIEFEFEEKVLVVDVGIIRLIFSWGTSDE